MKRFVLNQLQLTEIKIFKQDVSGTNTKQMIWQLTNVSSFEYLHNWYKKNIPFCFTKELFSYSVYLNCVIKP
jgi:hypothetical protein